MTVPSLVRYGTFPAVMALVISGVAWAPSRSMPLAWLAGLVACGLAAVALLERWFPFNPRWQAPDRDFPAA